jgi:hypothetical protein
MVAEDVADVRGLGWAAKRQPGKYGLVVAPHDRAEVRH